ncbi:Nitroreductase family protein [Chitinispirillum alkaliphilum]|nr:Nitroreductase family protein [Chitinispirillum alkaliphilum]
MEYSDSVTELIKRRISVRSYSNKPIELARKKKLEDFLGTIKRGPLGSEIRLRLISSTTENRNALKGLGTYGVIKKSRSLAGAVKKSQRDLEDLGYVMEQAVLLATEMNLGTCWLGGLFTRSSFASALSLESDEQMPAVISVGYIKDYQKAKKAMIRRLAGSSERKPWEELFYEEEFGNPLHIKNAGKYIEPLRSVRLAPSAANKQPWRIIRTGNAWHFYLVRKKGYRGFTARLIKMADIQRLDIGIAMCHWEMTAREIGLEGSWVFEQKASAPPDELTEYVVSWRIS